MRKNILILCHNYGMQFLESCNQYAQAFDQVLYKVTVVYLIGPENSQVEDKTVAEQVIFLNLPKASMRGLKWRAIRKLTALCRETNFTTVICHRYKPTYIMLWVARFVRIQRLFFVMHALDTFHAWARRWLATRLYQPNMIFAGVSDAVAMDLRACLTQIPPRHITTFYNVIDHRLFEPKILSRELARQELGIAPTAFVFGNVGRLIEIKDHTSLLRALALIKPDCPAAQVTIIGDGRLEKNLKQLTAQLELTNDVLFTGFIADGFRFMQAFDVLVLCSTYEAFGRVLLEAMMARVPVIAAQAHGIPEVIGATGYLVTPRQPQELATVMRQLYTAAPEKLRQLGEQGYARMVEKFSPAAFQQTFLQYVNEDA